MNETQIAVFIPATLSLDDNWVLVLFWCRSTITTHSKHISSISQFPQTLMVLSSLCENTTSMFIQ